MMGSLISLGLLKGDEVRQMVKEHEERRHELRVTLIDDYIAYGEVLHDNGTTCFREAYAILPEADCCVMISDSYSRKESGLKAFPLKYKSLVEFLLHEVFPIHQLQNRVTTINGPNENI